MLKNFEELRKCEHWRQKKKKKKIPRLFRKEKIDLEF